MTAGEAAGFATQDRARMAVALSRFSEVLGTIPEGGTLVLQCCEGTDPLALEHAVRSLQGMPFALVLVPFGWTQGQIDAEAVRLAVLAEREAWLAAIEASLGLSAARDAEEARDGRACPCGGDPGCRACK